MSLVSDIADGLSEHRLLTFASAIAYQIISSLIPFVLFALALAGILELDDLWTEHLRPDLREGTSDEVFALLDATVDQVLNHKQTCWVTIGLVVVLWEVGGAVRATMEALDDIYAVGDRRTRRDKYVTSTWLAAVVGLLWLGVFALLLTGGGVLGVLSLAFLLAGVVAAAFAVGKVLAAPRDGVRPVRSGSGSGGGR